LADEDEPLLLLSDSDDSETIIWVRAAKNSSLITYGLHHYHTPPHSNIHHRTPPYTTIHHLADEDEPLLLLSLARLLLSLAASSVSVTQTAADYALVYNKGGRGVEHA